jgi:hypothetical protein
MGQTHSHADANGYAKRPANGSHAKAHLAAEALRLTHGQPDRISLSPADLDAHPPPRRW